MALRAGDASVWPPGTMWNTPFSIADVRHRLGERRIDVAEQEVDLVAIDQLVGLLHRGAGVAAGRILDQKFDLAAENAVLGVDLVEASWQPISSFLPSAA